MERRKSRMGIGKVEWEIEDWVGKKQIISRGKWNLETNVMRGD
jgi:hypothetical protein